MIFRFENCSLNSDDFTLQVNGVQKLVEPHVFDLILYLITHRERLVSRDELFKNLWAGRQVCDATLSNNIKCARAVLGDDGERQYIIKTIRGRGYQFIASVEINLLGIEDRRKYKTDNRINAKVFSSDLPTRLALIIVPLLILFIVSQFWLPVTETVLNDMPINNSEKSVAVLPFSNHGEPENSMFFTSGVHDDLLVQISKISSVKSISRPSVMAYLGSNKSIQVIGRELGVNTILQGSVQRATDQIRINVRLIDVLTNENIWAESYTSKLTAKNIFTIQEKIAKAIAEQLETVLSAKEIAHIHKLPTQNILALEQYFLAKENRRKNTTAGYQQAIEHLERAIELDPKFSTAYASLANLHVEQISLSGLPAKKQIEKAEELIAVTMTLDSNISELHQAIGKLNAYKKDYKAADLAYKQAINLNPNNAGAYACYAKLYLGYLNDIPQAVSLLSKAYQLNPKDDKLAVDMAQAFISAGRFDEARKIVEDIITRKPNYASAYKKLTFIEFYGDHNIAEAIRSLSKSISLDPNVPKMSMWMAFMYIHLGDNEQAILWLNHALALAPEFNGANHSRALIHELRGDYNAAMELYSKVPKDFSLMNESMFYLMKAGLKTNRSLEVIEHFKKLYPELFSANVKVNTTNFVVAFALGLLLKQQGDTERSLKILQASLNVSQIEFHSGWADNHNNWQAQIYLAMGNKNAALVAFSNVVESGFHSEKLIHDSAYNELRDEPKFQQLVDKMKLRLKIERGEIKNMKSRGELYDLLLIQ